LITKTYPKFQKRELIRALAVLKMVPIMNPGLGATAREECAGAKKLGGNPPEV
jgi:hypothetical protein